MSAGYDAHYADDLAGERLSVDGYGALASMLCDAAADLCDGRIVFALEGGYHPVALPWSIRRTIEILAAMPPTPDPLGPIVVAEPAGFAAMLAHVRTLHAL